MLQISFTFRNQAKRADTELRRILSEQTVIKEEKIDILDNSFIENEDNDHQAYDDSYSPVSPKYELEIFECDLSKKEYNDDEKNYLEHLQSHKSKVTCTICNKGFKNKSLLKKHMHNKHADSHECLVCSEEFKSEALLNQHMASHHDVKEETDDKTDQVNSNDGNLIPCTTCGLKFRPGRSLGQHMKKHKREKPCAFICEYCNKDFAGKNGLRRHIKLHLQDRPYRCTQCPKKYPRQDQLTYHLKKHSDFKPNVCPHCTKGMHIYLYLNNLK